MRHFVAISISLILAASSQAKTLSIDQGVVSIRDQVQVDIRVNEPQGVTGTAFTITYDKTSLNLTQFENLFFQMMVKNPAAELGTSVAAANATGETSATKYILFKITFTRKQNAKVGEYVIGIVPTVINDPKNGWPSPGKASDILYGSDPSKPVSDPGAFPIFIKATETDKLNPGSVVFLPNPPNVTIKEK